MEMQINAARVKKLRQDKHWSQEELALCAGLSMRTVQRVEKQGTASNETLRALAGTLRVSPEELLTSGQALPYRHTQIGWTIIIVLALVWSVADKFLPAQTGLITGLIVLAVCLVFSTLTIQVDSSGIYWFFGPGLPRFKLAANQVASCQYVKNKWWWGWGIRFHPWGDWLYNVSGFDAVEVTLKSGKRFRLGTDEPLYLQMAIEAISKDLS